MAYAHGKEARVYVNGYDLSGYLTGIKGSNEADTAEVSTFGDSAKERISGLRDASITGEGVFDGATSAEDQVFAAALGVNNGIFTVMPQGDTLGNRAYGLSAEETSYESDADLGDAVKFSFEAQGNVGNESGVVLRALAAATASGTATGVDGAGTTTQKVYGYLQVTAIAGGTLTVKVQDSADDSTYTDLLTFSAVSSAHASERMAAAGTTRRYTRTIWTLNGGSATFNVVAGRL